MCHRDLENNLLSNSDLSDASCRSPRLLYRGEAAVLFLKYSPLVNRKYLTFLKLQILSFDFSRFKKKVT